MDGSDVPVQDDLNPTRACMLTSYPGIQSRPEEEHPGVCSTGPRGRELAPVEGEPGHQRISDGRRSGSKRTKGACVLTAQNPQLIA